MIPERDGANRPPFGSSLWRHRRALAQASVGVRNISWDERNSNPYGGVVQARLTRSEEPMGEKRRSSVEEAKRVGDEIGVDWSRFDLDQFRRGMDVEFEHGSHDPQTDVTHDDPIVTGKIALAHTKEFPDYYARLERMEAEAERDWAAKKT